MRCVALVAVGLLVPALAGAQQRATLTLSEALEIARERNPEYQQAVNSVRAQGAQLRAGWGAFLPTVSADLSFNGYDQRTLTGQDDFGQPVSLQTPIGFQQSSASQSLSAQLTLFDGLRNLNSLRATRATATAAEATRDFERNRLDAQVTGRFYEALRTEQLIALEERLLTSARQQFDNTQRLFRTAGATQEDILGAEADVANQELQLERARGDALKAILDVKQQMGISEGIEFEVAGELPQVWDPTELDSDSLVGVVLGSSPTVLRSEAQADAAGLRATAQRGSRWPTISLRASLSRSMSLSSYDALFELNPQNRAFSFGMNLNFPLFTGFQTSAGIANATLEERNAEASLRVARLSVERSVRGALIDVRNTYRGLQLAERSAELSLERLRLARERYAIGAIDFASLQLIINGAAGGERQLVNARFQFAQAVVALEEVVGQPVRP